MIIVRLLAIKSECNALIYMPLTATHSANSVVGRVNDCFFTALSVNYPHAYRISVNFCAPETTFPFSQ